MKFPMLHLRKQLLFNAAKFMETVFRTVKIKYQPPWYWTVKDLRRFPKGSLGEAFAKFLDDNQYEIMPCFETHDIYHILLEYGTKAENEVEMQCFLFAAGKRSLAVYLTILIGHLILPEYWQFYKRAFLRGKGAENIAKWDFQHLLGEQVEFLKAKIFRERIEEPPLFI